VFIFALLFFLERKARSSVFLPVFYFLSTLPHELAHFVVALLLGGNPSFPNFIPRRANGVWILGQVKFYATPLNAFPAGMAPLLLLPLAVFVYLKLSFPVGEILTFFLIRGAFPSSQDVRVAFSFPLSAMLWIWIFVGVAYFFDEVQEFWHNLKKWE